MYKNITKMPDDEQLEKDLDELIRMYSPGADEKLKAENEKLIEKLRKLTESAEKKESLDEIERSLSSLRSYEQSEKLIELAEDEAIDKDRRLGYLVQARDLLLGMDASQVPNRLQEDMRRQGYGDITIEEYPAITLQKDILGVAEKFIELGTFGQYLDVLEKIPTPDFFCASQIFDSLTMNAETYSEEIGDSGMVRVFYKEAERYLVKWYQEKIIDAEERDKMMGSLAGTYMVLGKEREAFDIVERLRGDARLVAKESIVASLCEKEKYKEVYRLYTIWRKEINGERSLFGLASELADHDFIQGANDVLSDLRRQDDTNTLTYSVEDSITTSKIQTALDKADFETCYKLTGGYHERKKREEMIGQIDAAKSKK